MIMGRLCGVGSINQIGESMKTVLKILEEARKKREIEKRIFLKQNDYSVADAINAEIIEITRVVGRLLELEKDERVSNWRKIDKDNLPEVEVLAINLEKGSFGYKEKMLGSLGVDFDVVICEGECERLENCTHYIDPDEIGFGEVIGIEKSITGPILVIDTRKVSMLDDINESEGCGHDKQLKAFFDYFCELEIKRENEPFVFKTRVHQSSVELTEYQKSFEKFCKRFGEEDLKSFYETFRETLPIGPNKPKPYQDRFAKRHSLKSKW